MSVVATARYLTTLSGLDMTNHYMLIPRFIGYGLAEAERKDAEHLNLLAWSLQTHVDTFRNALLLFDHSLDLFNSMMAEGDPVFDPQRDYQGWVFIAARAAAMEIYHFWKTLAAIRNRAGVIPTLKPHYDSVAMLRVQQLFESQFPGAERMRQAIAHAAEMMRTAATFANNFTIPPANDGGIVSGMRGRTLDLVHEKVCFSVDISEANLDRLQTLAVRAFAVLRPMEAACLGPLAISLTPLPEGRTDHQ